jgi:WD40 repeat protein
MTLDKHLYRGLLNLSIAALLLLAGCGSNQNAPLEPVPADDSLTLSAPVEPTPEIHGTPINDSNAAQLSEMLTLSGQQMLQAAPTPIGSLAFSGDGAILAAGNVEGNSDITIWQVAGGELLQTLRGHSDNVYGLAFTPDGAVLASSSRDLTVRLWDLESGSQIQSLSGQGEHIYGLAINPDRNILASASADGALKLWEIDGGQLLLTLNTSSHFIFHLAFSPDGRLLANDGEEGVITVWGIPD